MYVWADKQPLSPVSGSVGAGGGNQEEKDMSDYHDPDPATATAATAADTGEENWNKPFDELMENWTRTERSI